MKADKYLMGMACAGMLALTAAAQTSMYGWVQKRVSTVEAQTAYELDVISLGETPAFDNKMTLDYTAMATGGVGIADGKLSAVYVNKTNLLWGELTAYLYEYDTNTWQQMSKTVINDPTVVALETAQHMESGTVYGMFYQSDMNTHTFDWATIDYRTMTRTVLGTSSHRMVAIGVTRDQILYGVATDGYLYRFNPVTRIETQVGKTGVSVASTAIQSGEIDQESGVFYWAYTSGQGASALYTVDLESGAATKVCNFANNEKVSGLMMIPAPIAGDVPASVTDLQVSMSAPSTTGVVSFIAPSTHYDGTALSGNVNYTVQANDETVATGQVQAGKPKTLEVTVDEGMTEFVVWVSNDRGDSPKSRQLLYVGYDVPEPVGDVALAIDGGVASLSWSAPTRGLHDAYMGQLTYDVIRYPGGTTVAQGIAENTFSETLTNANVMVFKYGVIAHNGTQQSSEAVSNEAKYGTTSLYEVPIDFTFADDRYVSELRATDSNGDGKTWAYNTGNKALTSTNDRKNLMPGDDWVFLPGMSLRAGYTYSVQIHAKTYLASYPTRIEAKLGKAAEVNAMSISVLDTLSLSTNQYAWYKADVKVEADGGYYLGIHDVSETGGFSTYIDDVIIEVASAPQAPDSVTSLIVTPDPTGELMASLSFVAPAQCTDGTAITELDRIDVMRDGELVASLNHVPAGQSVSGINDVVPADGMYTYSVVAYLGDDAGLVAEQAVYVGIDIPEAPRNLYAVDKGTSIELHWDKASTRGINGGLVKPDEVYYDVLAGDMVTHLDTVNTNMYVIDSITSVGSQRIARFYVKAHNRAGRNDYYITTVLPVGVPFALPFGESFAGGKASQFCWTESGTATLTVNPQMSADDDGGCYMMVCPEAGTQGAFNTGKITLRNAANPELIFSYLCNIASADADLSVVIRHSDYSTDTISVIPFAESRTTAWNMAKLSLSDYVDEDYVVIKFVAASRHDGRVSMFIDGISVRDVKDYDLSVDATTLSQAIIGQTLPVAAVVTNLGDQPVEGCQLLLYDGEQCVDKIALEQTILAEQRVSRTFNYQTQMINQVAGELQLKVVVSLEQDQNLSNNESVTSVRLRDANASPVEDLAIEDGVVTWSAPSLPSEEVIDDFESYASQQIQNVGQWTMYDGDRSEAAAISSADYGHQGEPFAFMTFNPGELDLLRHATLTPHSGNQCMMAIVGFTDGNKVDADNWLISPQLPGKEQTVSFWVRNASQTETYEVLYSKDSSDFSSFRVIKSGAVSNQGWNQVEVELPDGTQYFAIRHTTQADSAMIMLVDDATFTQLANAPIAYRVYCDGRLVATVSDATQVDVAAVVAAGEHHVAVTAVYASGAESALRTITVVCGNSFDVTGDGKVDVADVNEIINQMLGRSDNSNGDVTSDGRVDITDVNAVINTMLGK